jgi:iron(III) transport system ATP-binding protein
VVAVRLENVTKRFGDLAACDNVSLEVADGELFFLLGPSGCGKTTILRTIAGFEEPDGGAVYFDDRNISATPAHKRNAGMVFQNYALWPHMTVADNVAYGLKVRSVTRQETTGRVAGALEMVRMSGLESRYPNQLSGGQQQRVALARALVVRPDCLLLDEPLSNLDAKLRLEMRDEIRRIHEGTGVTTIYVTHDQKEALSMAERLAVIRDGRIVQVGGPEDVYRRPVDIFVAAFVGETNLFEGMVEAVDGPSVTLATAAGPISGTAASSAPLSEGSRAVASIRPEDVSTRVSPGQGNSFPCEVTLYTFLGDVGRLTARVAGVEVRALLIAPREPERPSFLYFPPDHVLVFAAATSGGAPDVP